MAGRRDHLKIKDRVLEEARAVMRLYGFDDPMEVITTQGICRVHIPEAGDPSKRCGHCRYELTFSSFNKSSRNSDGMQVNCKQCDHKIVRESNRKRQDKVSDEIRKAAAAAKKEIKDELRGHKGKIVREVWSTDPAKRMADLTRVLPTALKDYDGQEAEISVALSIPIDEIRAAIESSKELQQALQFAQTVAISKVEANAYKLAKESNNAAAVKFWLTNKTSNWSERSSVDVRSVGFGVPDDDEAPRPILKIVNERPED